MRRAIEKGYKETQRCVFSLPGEFEKRVQWMGIQKSMLSEPSASAPALGNHWVRPEEGMPQCKVAVPDQAHRMRSLRGKQREELAVSPSASIPLAVMSQSVTSSSIHSFIHADVSV